SDASPRRRSHWLTESNRNGGNSFMTSPFPACTLYFRIPLWRVVDDDHQDQLRLARRAASGAAASAAISRQKEGECLFHCMAEYAELYFAPVSLEEHDGTKENMRMMLIIWIATALALSASHSRAIAQVDLRIAQIERERDEKVQRLEPDDVSRTERFLRRFKDEKFMERIDAGYSGLRAKLGKMPAGGGFAIGPEYF